MYVYQDEKENTSTTILSAKVSLGSDRTFANTYYACRIEIDLFMRLTCEINTLEIVLRIL